MYHRTIKSRNYQFEIDKNISGFLTFFHDLGSSIDCIVHNIACIWMELTIESVVELNKSQTMQCNSCYCLFFSTIFAWISLQHILILIFYKRVVGWKENMIGLDGNLPKYLFKLSSMWILNNIFGFHKHYPGQTLNTIYSPSSSSSIIRCCKYIFW